MNKEDTIFFLHDMLNAAESNGDALGAEVLRPALAALERPESSKRVKREKEYISIAEASEILGVSYNHVRGTVIPNVPHFKVGRRILIREEAFRKYLKSLERGRPVY